MKRVTRYTGRLDRSAPHNVIMTADELQSRIAFILQKECRLLSECTETKNTVLVYDPAPTLAVLLADIYTNQAPRRVSRRYLGKGSAVRTQTILASLEDVRGACAKCGLSEVLPSPTRGMRYMVICLFQRVLVVEVTILQELNRKLKRVKPALPARGTDRLTIGFQGKNRNENDGKLDAIEEWRLEVKGRDNRVYLCTIKRAALREISALTQRLLSKLNRSRQVRVARRGRATWESPSSNAFWR